jgi:hypothetical protein
MGAPVQAVLSCAWSPQGAPLASCDKGGDLSFWRGEHS